MSAAQAVTAASDGWLGAALVPLLAMAPVLWRVATGGPRERLVAQNLAALAAALTLLLAAQGFGRPAYVDLALVLSLLGPAGTLVYARFLGGVPPARPVYWAAVVAVPLTVVPLCVAAGPGRQLVKLLVVGALLVAGGVVTSAGSRIPADGAGDGTTAPGTADGRGSAG
ncbi:monovalent cation/H+ antiporter complex subunit F [Streptomyces daliensis]